MRRALWPVAVSVAVAGAMFLAVFPTRTWLAQRHSLAAAEQRLMVLDHQNQDLTAQVRRLDTDAEIERLARADYNLVRPGEEAYAILPPPGAGGPGHDSAPGTPSAGPALGTPAPAAATTARGHQGLLARVLGRICPWC